MCFAWLQTFIQVISVNQECGTLDGKDKVNKMTSEIESEGRLVPNPLQHGTNKRLLSTTMRCCVRGWDSSWNGDLKTQCGESQQPWSARSRWTFHILPFVRVNASGGMWYPVHILCHYSTIPSSTFCYASYLLTVCLLWSQESTCCNPLSWCRPVWAVNGRLPEKKDSPSKMS